MSMSIEDCLTPRPPRVAPNIPKNVMDQFNMTNKICVITGASRGIGYRVAEGLAEAGASIVAVYSTPNPAVEEKFTSLGKQLGVRTLCYVCNVADHVQVEKLVSDVVAIFGQIDVFLANAGISIPRPVIEQSLEEYHAQMNVNVHGIFYCAKYVGKVFKSQGFGNMIITGSICARVVTVPVDESIYNTTKAAATQLGKSLAREWREFARVNIVAPGYIDTEMSADLYNINEACRMAALGRQGKY